MPAYIVHETAPGAAPADLALVTRYGVEPVIAALAPLVGEARRARLAQAIAQRTRDVTFLLDQFYDPHNQAAVVRSAEAFGLCEVHVVPGKQGASISKAVSQGAHKWIDVPVHADALGAVSTLKRAGYALYGADLAGVDPSAIPSGRPVCVVMGAEKDGLSPLAREACDGFVTIAMRGLVESFNVSVAAALIMQAIVSARAHRPLPEAERRLLLARYLVQSVSRPEVVLANLAAR